MQDSTISQHHANSHVRGLIVLNAALLILLGVIVFATSADAQQARGRGEYTMVSGGANGADSAVAYIVDVQNQEMVAVTYNQRTKELDGVGYRNLVVDAQGLVRTRTPSTN